MAKRVVLRPVTTECAVAQVTDRYSEYPSEGLTPVRLAEIFKEADAGDVLRQAELFEEMEEKDPHLFSQLQTRKNAVTGLDYEIIPFDPDNPRDKEIAEFVQDQIGSIESFEDVMLDLLDAIGKGFAVSEIMWGYDAGHVVVTDIRSRYQKRFFWDQDNVFRVRTEEAPAGIELPKNKFIVHKYKARSGHPSRAGVLRVVAWMYLFKNYNLKDWVAFCEVYGQPLRLGKYAQGASEDDKRALMQALSQIGSDAAGIIPDTTLIDFITSEAKASSADLYERLARYCDEQISKAVLGQTLTSDSGGGSYAQSKTHNDVRHDLTVADCKSLAATLRRDLIRPLVLFNFGDDTRVPYLRFDAAEAEDLTQTATIISTLVRDVGLAVPTSYLYKKFSIPKPEGGEEIAKPPTSGMGALPFKASTLALKATQEPGHGTQERIDQLAAAAVKSSAGSFRKALAPVLKMVEKAGSLEELRGMMGDEEAIAKVFGEMDVSDIEELLQKAMVYADLEGRMVELDE